MAILMRFLRHLRNRVTYRSYDEYRQHQAEKTSDPERRSEWLGKSWTPTYEAFLDVFRKHGDVFQPGKTAACLGARTGQEVQALRDLGIDALGYDLVACEPLVVEGDIHDMPLEDASVDLVYSNVFDHALYPDKFILEIERILKPGGHVLLMLQVRASIRRRHYDVTYVDDSSEVVRLFKNSKILIDRNIPEKLGMNWEIVAQKV